ncbi:MAG: ATP-binding protein [Putridiphycobacter sp.]|nr:ATP-binding protein [Putridiphycobacter sp.]
MKSLLTVFIAVYIVLPNYCYTQSRFIEDSLEIVEVCENILQHPEKHDSLYTELKKIAGDNSPVKLQDIYYYNYAKAMFRLGKTEIALQNAKAGLNLFSKNKLPYKASKHYNIIAAVHSYNNEYPEAIKAFTKAVEILEANNDDLKAALIKSNIANIFFSINDFESAYQYSSEAVKVLNEHNDTINLPGITAVLAISAIRLERIEEGAKLTTESIYLSEKYNNPIGLIVGYLSRGEWQYLIKNYEGAKSSYLKSLEYATIYQQTHYILLDHIGLLKVEVALNNYADATTHGIKALELSQALSNNNTSYAILKNLSYAYAGQKQYGKAFEHLDSAHSLYIATANIESKNEINELLIKYESEKKEKALLANDLEIANQKIKINKRNNLIYGLAVLLTIFIFLYGLYRNKQKQKITQLQQTVEKNILLATIEGEEKERERLANELHDGIASTLTGVRLKMEQKGAENNLEIIEHLKILHEDTRRISHNLMPLSLANASLDEAIINYANENTTSATKLIAYSLNNDALELSPIYKNSLYRICQELIQNVLKHANATICTIQLAHTDKRLNISIEDDGIGFNVASNMNSQGLKSIKKRVEIMGGTIEIESTNNAGTLINITINKQI